MNTTATTTAPAPAHLFGVDDRRKYANEARAAAAGLESCTHCGRGVRPGAGWVTVVVNGGATVAHPDSPEANDDTDPGFMGAWVLGSTCAKGIPATARARWNGWDE